MAVTEAVVTETRLEWQDMVVVVAYFVVVIAIGLYASCRAAKGTVSGYFLAGRQMNFFMVGCSLFVSNIGSEHFIGLAGSGAAGGIGVGAWEFNAILLLQLLGFVFLPVYIACRCYTMPEYLYKRFGGQRIRVYFAVLSLILYIFTKCSVDLYTGAIFIQQSLGWDLYLSIFILIIIVGILTITGGLTAVIYTDTIQAILMVAGAMALTIIGFQKIGWFEGLWRKYPYAMTNVTVPNTTCHQTNKNWYTMLREPNDPDMPWPGFLLGQTPGSIWYWCADQVIVQRALAAKSLSHAQASTIMAAFIKILPLFIMVMPGMIARVLYPNAVACVTEAECLAYCQSSTGCTNIAYPKLVLGIMGTGWRGLMMAVMVAALMSDLDSIFNSASTLFTIDIWKRMRRRAGVREQMIVGRVFVLVMIGVAIAWVPVVKETQGGQVFIYIQEVSNYLAPPVTAVYLIGILWPRCNEQGCFWGLMAGFVTGVTRLILVFVYKGPDKCGDPDNRPSIIKDLHYMYFAMILFWITVIVTMGVSMATKPPSYKRLYRTLFWTRRAKYDQADVDSGKIVAVWHGPCSYSVVEREEAQTYDNKAMDDVTNNDVTNGDVTGNTNETNHNSVEIKMLSNRLEAKSKRRQYKGLKKQVYVVSDGMEMSSEGDDLDESNDKPSCKQMMTTWLCGVVGHGEQNERLNQRAMEREARISSLEQHPVAKGVLYFLMVLILLIGVALYCFWSLWRYNPEGDVWSRMDQEAEL